ncbi:MAG TPA: hypothetical protein DDZ51_08645 [Planctomycetaceae bacterium]|nr:hypothetical protein [Planctomycetaceae bacterium]
MKINGSTEACHTPLRVFNRSKNGNRRDQKTGLLAYTSERIIKHDGLSEKKYSFFSTTPIEVGSP